MAYLPIDDKDLATEIRKLAEGGGALPEIVSAGENVTIPAGSTIAEALQIILDKIDPSGGA